MLGRIVKLLVAKGGWYALGLVGLCVTGYIVWLRHELADRTRELEHVAMVADSALAEADSVHRVALDSQHIVFVRRIVQVTQERDALDRTLKLVRQANYDLMVSLKSYQGTATGLATASADTLRSHFEVRDPPYSITAEAMLVPKPKVSTLGIKVRLDSLPLSVRVGCSTNSLGGIRSATISVTAPPWAVVGLPSLSQSPEVCQSPSVALRASPSRWALFGKLVAFGGLAFGVAKLSGWP